MAISPGTQAFGIENPRSLDTVKCKHCAISRSILAPSGDLTNEMRVATKPKTMSNLVQFEIQVQFGTARADLHRLCFLQQYESSRSVFHLDLGYYPKGCKEHKSRLSRRKQKTLVQVNLSSKAGRRAFSLWRKEPVRCSGWQASDKPTIRPNGKSPPEIGERRRVDRDVSYSGVAS